VSRFPAGFLIGVLRLAYRRYNLATWAAKPMKSGATTCGWGILCTGSGALTPRVMRAAPEWPADWAPSVSQTCAATMPHSEKLHVELLSDHVIALRRRLESPNPVNAELALEKVAEASALGPGWGALVASR
jgi:biotin carboxylase